MSYAINYIIVHFYHLLQYAFLFLPIASKRLSVTYLHMHTSTTNNDEVKTKFNKVSTRTFNY